MSHNPLEKAQSIDSVPFYNAIWRDQEAQEAHMARERAYGAEAQLYGVQMAYTGPQGYAQEDSPMCPTPSFNPCMVDQHGIPNMPSS